MTSEGTRPRTALLLAAGVALLIATRVFHPISGLGNADIAGIFYEADLINSGGVPYVDAIDVKPPGTFFVLAAVFKYLGRELWKVDVVYALWCLLAGPAIWIAARALYRRTDTAALAVLLYLGWIGTFDYNYSAWMATAYAWAFACLIAGVRGGKAWWHLAAGAFAALALTLKGQAIVLGPVFALVWWWGRRNAEPGARWTAWPLWLAGAALGLAPLVGWYAAHDATRELAAALLPIEEARAYAGRAQSEGFWPLRAWRIPWQHLRVFPLHSLLVAAVLVGAWWVRRGDVPEDRSKELAAPLAPQVILWLLSVVGCGLGGMRFYIHYLPQYLPALALLAVHPYGLELWRTRGRAGLALLATTGVVAAVLVARIPLGFAGNHDYKGTKNAARAGEWIKARTEPDDRILVWGWSIWSVYYHAERRSPSAIFKMLGQVTEYNQNGMFSKSREAPFRPGPHADRLIADIERKKPVYIVRSPLFFPGVTDDPMKEFAALNAIFKRDYVLDKRFGRIKVYRLKSWRPTKLRGPGKGKKAGKAGKAGKPARPKKALPMQ